MSDQTSDIVQRARRALRAVEYAGDDGSMCPWCEVEVDCIHEDPCGHSRDVDAILTALDRLEALEKENEALRSRGSGNTCSCFVHPDGEERTCRLCDAEARAEALDAENERLRKHVRDMDGRLRRLLAKADAVLDSMKGKSDE